MDGPFQSTKSAFFAVENLSLDFQNVLHIKKKNGSFKNHSLNGSLGNPKWGKNILEHSFFKNVLIR